MNATGHLRRALVALGLLLLSIGPAPADVLPTGLDDGSSYFVLLTM